MKKITYGLLALAGLLVVAQLFQPERNTGQVDGPDHISQVVAVPAPIRNILQASCYDCHSNHTNYPWYANLQPFSGFLAQHVNEGKEELNFSAFTRYPLRVQDHKLEEVIELVEAGEMPLDSYTWLHRDAKLNPEQAEALIAWAKSSRKQLNYKKPAS